MKKVKDECPLPESKAFMVPKLEEDWQEALGDENKSKALMIQDRATENIQNTMMTAMGPLSKLWIKLDNIMKNGGRGEANLQAMLEMLEKTIICIGQANVHLNYYRRLPIVAKLMGNPKTAQSLLKKNSKKLRGRKLLGTKFQKIVKKSLKKRNDAKELKRSLDSTERKPFQNRPSTSIQFEGRRPNEYRSPLAGLYEPNRRYEQNRQGDSQASVNTPSQETCFTKSTQGKTKQMGGGESKVYKLKFVRASGKGGLSRKRVSPTPSTKAKFASSHPTATSAKIRGEAEVLSKQLEKVYKGSDNIVICFGGSNRVHRTAMAKRESPLAKIQCNRKRKHSKRNRGDAKKGGNRRNTTHTRPVYGSFVPKGEEKRGFQASFQLKTAEQIHSVPSLQNGNNERSSEYGEAQRLHGKTGSKRCLFLGPDSQESPKVPPFQLERETLPVSGNGIWVRASSQNFHENIEARYQLLQEDGDENHDILGRPHTVKSGPSGIDEGSENSNIHFGEPGFSNELGEIGDNSDPSDRIFGVHHKYHGNEGIVARRQTEKGSWGMPEHGTQGEAFSKRIGQFDRQAHFVYVSSGVSPVALQTFANAECERSVGKSELREYGSIEQTEQRRDKLVDKVSGINK